MTDEFEEEQETQPLVEHLTELRDRLVRAVLAVVIIFISLIYFARDIYNFVAQPLMQALEGTSTMIATDVTATFLTPFKLTFFVSVFIAMPFLLYQIWAFIAPALYRNEKRLAKPIFASSIVLFYLGIAFAYFIVLPPIFMFFNAITPDDVALMPDITTFLSLVIKLFFAFGLAFEIPVATVILVTAGVISPEGLAQKRPYVIVACFVIAMLMTPPDVVSQSLLAFPMWGLFEIGIFFGKLAIKNRPAQTEESEEA
ncbi:twin-arginine translocase subunit TatC [Marinagarivorans cellulosilyticus]|uniref:Sec-independent protein translocase protein TatC n=1 Tax=Marinagarivorans cellulosilyticus TaxID=2721545 RepID=A0AAN1WH85_9GAMM|nr:twin-arginine translocase subunit TatC [Marinagarivorans cellulosilyticus]BCD97554.1 sec-independent protein translocase protein TatC [Marinagarivorans cellulosilyticus]